MVGVSLLAGAGLVTLPGVKQAHVGSACCCLNPAVSIESKRDRPAQNRVTWTQLLVVVQTSLRHDPDLQSFE